MANLTTKELTALDDQIRHEQVLVKKYQAMACLCTDAYKLCIVGVPFSPF